jgi:hypothetical protein
LATRWHAVAAFLGLKSECDSRTSLSTSRRFVDAEILWFSLKWPMLRPPPELKEARDAREQRGAETPSKQRCA